MDIVHLIQSAVAPVFLLSGVGVMLGVLTARLARLVDRARALERQFAESKAREGQLAGERGGIQTIPKQGSALASGATGMQSAPHWEPLHAAEATGPTMGAQSIPHYAGSSSADVAEQLQVLSRRARYINIAITLCAVAALLVALVVILLFANAFLEAGLSAAIAVLFVASMLALTGAFVAFLIEVRIAMAALRIGVPSLE